MNHLEKICEYIRESRRTGITIERSSHLDVARQFIMKQCRLFQPEVVVKAGLGAGSLVLDLADEAELVVVIEPDFEALADFIRQHGGDPKFDRIRVINGDLHDLPLDWYCTDMIVCVDYLDFHNVAAVLDEFKRIVDFEGYLVLATPVLHDDDIDGVYDELFRKIQPLHNDYYVPLDLRTVLGLKKFKELDSTVSEVQLDLDDIVVLGKTVSSRTGTATDDSYMEYIEQNSEAFGEMYKRDGQLLYERYEASAYRSEKPGKKEYDEEVAEYTRRMGRTHTAN
ncbi:MAG: class I SAM-dependent methyltransferase, partial [Spirochaetota bacterium]